MQLYIFTLKKL